MIAIMLSLLEMIFFIEYALCQNKLKLYFSTDFTPIDWFFEKKSNKNSKTKFSYIFWKGLFLGFLYSILFESPYLNQYRSKKNEMTCCSLILIRGIWILNRKQENSKLCFKFVLHIIRFKKCYEACKYRSLSDPIKIVIWSYRPAISNQYLKIFSS